MTNETMDGSERLLDREGFTFKLSETVFSRKLSYLFISEGDHPAETGETLPQLALERLIKQYHVSRQPDTLPVSSLVFMRPYRGDGGEVAFSAAATPSVLQLDMPEGRIRICFDSQDVVRICGHGAGLRFYAPLKEHEAAIDRLDGTCQACFDALGELLFVPLKGSYDLKSVWNWKKAGTERILLDILPDEEGNFELAVHYAIANTRRLPAYRPFEDCVLEAAEDFSDWYAMSPQSDGPYEYTRRIAAYSTWICYVGALGRVKRNVLLYEKQNCAFCWHSAFIAMSASQNADVAVDMLLTVFDYQDEYGQIPDLIDDKYVNYLATKPPYQGVALLYLIDRMGDRLTQAHCERLYAPLVKLCGWWTTLRDTDGDGVPQYNQGCESGMDSTSMLGKGVPAECPDLITYLIMLMEALGILAKRTGRVKEAEAWEARSQKLLHSLVTEFWDGKRFIARVSSSHDIVDTSGLDSFTPVMLGHRLPDDIMDAVCKELEDNYLTEHGLLGHPQNAPDRKFAYYLGFHQFRFALGLYDANRIALARRIMEGFCQDNAVYLPKMGYLYGERPSVPGINTELFYEDYGKCSSLAGGMFLVMDHLLAELLRPSEGRRY